MKNMFTYFILIALIILIFGCSSTKRLTSESERAKDDEKSTGIINEFFDPLILNEEDLKVKKTISVESKSDQMDAVHTQPPTDQQKSDDVPGFRVQICAVADEERARQIQREAILKFVNEEVYLIYDSPYYKVRVGNCLTRYEADKLQQLAIEKGFDDAWVVRTKIKQKSKGISPSELENKPPN